MDSARPRSVLSVSPSVFGGGAERVALDLHQEYLSRGIGSALAVGALNAEEPGALAIPNDAHRSAWARTLLPVARRMDPPGAGRSPGTMARFASRALRVAAEPGRYARVGSGNEDFAFPESQRVLGLAPTPPEVLHLHNLHGGYFDIRSLPELSAQLPTFWTLHDAWAFTGHCAYPIECERWRTGCGDCPDLERYVPIRGDKSWENRAVKASALRESRLNVACPSAWLARMIGESGVLGEQSEVRVVPNGVDSGVFSPGDKAAAREQLGLPPDRTIVLSAARGVKSSAYKGFVTYEAALRVLSGEPAASRLLALAVGQSGDEGAIGGVEARFVPFVTDPTVMACYYRAADIYVHPARAENLPLAIIEAMACGLPVVASAVGGIPELVVDGETGLLARPNDATDLAARTLELLLGDAARRQAMGRAATERVAESFTLQLQADRYLAWYRERLEEGQ